MPTWLAIVLAVSGWSPVIMMTLYSCFLTGFDGALNFSARRVNEADYADKNYVLLQDFLSTVNRRVVDGIQKPRRRSPERAICAIASKTSLRKASVSGCLFAFKQNSAGIFKDFLRCTAGQNNLELPYW